MLRITPLGLHLILYFLSRGGRAGGAWGDYLVPGEDGYLPKITIAGTQESSQGFSDSQGSLPLFLVLTASQPKCTADVVQEVGGQAPGSDCVGSNSGSAPYRVALVTLPMLAEFQHPLRNNHTYLIRAIVSID